MKKPVPFEMKKPVPFGHVPTWYYQKIEVNIVWFGNQMMEDKITFGHCEVCRSS
jgi:hypothetical protein